MIITRKYEFSSSHKIYNKNLNKEQNFELFGKCSNDHGHNYKLYVSFKGNINRKTGMVVNFKEIDLCVGKLLNTLDHQNLNNVLGDDIVVTTENLTIYVWKHIFKEYSELLYKIKIKETSRNSVTYYGN